jgi:hypothetical protein
MLNSLTQYRAITHNLGPLPWGNNPLFSSVVGQRKGPSGANGPSVQGIKNALKRGLKVPNIKGEVYTTCSRLFLMHLQSTIIHSKL